MPIFVKVHFIFDSTWDNAMNSGVLSKPMQKFYCCGRMILLLWKDDLYVVPISAEYGVPVFVV